MREVKVKRMDLLMKIKANREKHIKEYKEACDGYKEMAIQRIDEVMGDLKKRVEELKEGQAIALMGVHFGLEVPQSHEEDYDQVIMMLEMSIDEELTIKSDEFACYVMDNWKWRRDWENTKATYSNKVGAIR